MNTENKHKVTEVIKGIMVDRLSQLTEDMSNRDFIEFVMDRLEEEGVELDFEDEEVQEEITDLVGKEVLPLLFKILEWSVGKELPKIPS